MLHIPARLALSPKLLTAAAVKTGLPLPKTDLQTLLIHPRHHQNLLAIMILHDRRNQTFLIKLQFIHFKRRLYACNLVDILTHIFILPYHIKF